VYVSDQPRPESRPEAGLERPQSRPGTTARDRTRATNSKEEPIMTSTESLTYEVFVNDPPQHENAPLLPNGEPKGGSPVASTLISGGEDAVLTDPAFTREQADALGNWVAGKDRNLTHIFITHGHGDHWFAAQLLAERFDAPIVATEGTIEQMHNGVALRPL